MTKLAVLLTFLAVLAATTASTAGADAPIRGTFGHSDAFVDTEVCAAAPWGFDVDATEHEYGFFTGLQDRDGNTTKVIVHINYDATISANGKTIVERDTWEITFYPDGTWRYTGSSVHIQGPGGVVIKDAGQVVFNEDGSIAYMRGPHEQLSGVSFCPALV